MSAGLTPPKDLPEYDVTLKQVPVRDGERVTTGWRAEAEGHDITAGGDSAAEAVDVLVEAIRSEEDGDLDA